MRSSGLINLNVRLSYGLLGFGVHAVLMRTINSGQIRGVADALAGLNEMGHIATLVGGFDMIVDVYCEDVANLEDLLNEKIYSI